MGSCTFCTMHELETTRGAQLRFTLWAQDFAEQITQGVRFGQRRTERGDACLNGGKRFRFLCQIKEGSGVTPCQTSLNAAGMLHASVHPSYFPWGIICAAEKRAKARCAAVPGGRLASLLLQCKVPG